MIKCPLPWTGIAVEPDGTVKNCAVSSTRLGNLKYTPIKALLDNNFNKHIRAELTANTWPRACGHCERVEQIDPLFSNRSYQLNLHTDADIDYAGKHQLTQLDLRWSNTCNYACIYCGPYFSSLWATELDQKVNADREHFTKLKDYAYSGLNNLKEVYLAGGEPLLIKENLELLEELYRVNPGCLVRITTNASNLNNKIYRKIQEFTNVKWEVSVEAVGEQFEYIRYPGVWTEFESNIKQLLAEWPKESLGITMNYFLLNCNSIVETGKHLINLGFDENTVAVHPLTNPKYLDARGIPDESKERVIQYLTDYPNGGSTFGTSLQNCAEFLAKPFDRNIDDIVYSLNTIDKRRNLNFTKTFPNITKCLKI